MATPLQPFKKKKKKKKKRRRKSDTYAFKIPLLILVSSWLCGRINGWRISQPGCDPSFENLTCLATLKSCDTTKQFVCGWQYIYIYIYIYTYTYIHVTVHTHNFCSLRRVSMISSNKTMISNYMEKYHSNICSL